MPHQFTPFFYDSKVPTAVTENEVKLVECKQDNDV